jgi:hypothetical protein
LKKSDRQTQGGPIDLKTDRIYKNSQHTHIKINRNKEDNYKNEEE